MELQHLGAVELARRIARGELASRALLELYLDRISRFNPRLNAVVHLRAESARDRADEADRAQRRGEHWGPLHGLPITIKECFDWAGSPSTFGRLERREHRATEDAVAVNRLVQAGAIVFGKTNVPVDLADWQSFNPVYGATANPWDLSRSPGGSSGGAAAALAAGLTALELGSDLSGSIRMPSHFCGVYGHKPSFGIVPVRGHAISPGLPADDLNVVGPLARSAEDLERALRLMTGADAPRSRAWRLGLPEPDRVHLKDYRLALKTDDEHFPVDRDTYRTALQVADVLREAGASVTLDPPLPMASGDYYRLHLALARGSTASRRTAAEIDALQAEARATQPDDLGYQALMVRGLTQSHREWLERNTERERLREGWDRFFRAYDVLIAPVSPTPAPPHMHDVPKRDHQVMVDGLPRAMADTYFWIGLASIAYLPATTIPAGQSDAGLPIGLQIIGPEYADLRCIALARALEQAHRGFRPPPGY